MKQVVQNYKTSELYLEDVPSPTCRPGGVLVRTSYSLVSSGTERMKVKQARMNLIQMAKARPDKVKQVLQSVKQDGLGATINKVRERLDSLTPLGYSSAGVVEEVGRGIDEFVVGDRVACAGEGIACHAEYVFVPRNLCVSVPEGVDLRDAAFATVGAIAMNGVRQANVTLGDRVLVVGLGLVGLLAVQILKAAGCCVIGVDLSKDRVELAGKIGADAALLRGDASLQDTVMQLTGGHGVDVAYLAASTTSADPLQLAGELTRDRGTIVIVGMMPVEADWETYYRKELSVVMSRSYGPGRYDPNFEIKGIDYPIGYIRWTERRNLEEFLRLVAEGKVLPRSIGSSVFDFAEAPEAYRQLREEPDKHAVGILFEYPAPSTAKPSSVIRHSGANGKSSNGQVAIGMIGAGNFATGTLIPALKRIPALKLKAICSARGLSARSAAKRHGFEYCANDFRAILDDDDIDAVVIATRHDTHAQMAAEAALAGKHVFVEKPLALDRGQLEQVIQAKTQTGRIIMPGFNRRFSPLSQAVRAFFQGRSSPIEVICRVNAGALKEDSWYKDSDEGGWRIISEGCHFIDLIQYLCDSRAVRVQAEMIGGHVPGAQHDNCAVTLKMEDGSIGVLIYVANGDSSYQKERVEVFGQGRSALIDNFRHAELWQGGKKKRIKANGSGKGHLAELTAFVNAVASDEDVSLSFEDAVHTTFLTFAIAMSVGSGSIEEVQGASASA